MSDILDAPDPVEEAASALRATGRQVEPIGGDFLLWLLDGKAATDDDVLAAAILAGLMGPPVQAQ